MFQKCKQLSLPDVIKILRSFVKTIDVVAWAILSVIPRGLRVVTSFFKTRSQILIAKSSAVEKSLSVFFESSFSG